MCKLKVLTVTSKSLVCTTLITLLQFAYAQNFYANESYQTPIPTDIFTLQKLAMKQMVAAWKLTNIGNDSDVSANIAEFWRKTKLAYEPIHEQIKVYDRRINNNRPYALMNKVLDLQDLENLKALSESNSENPIIKWRVKWIEVSSMATHIHRLYNKRLRDIMNNEPYIKTVAQAVYKYMGYPWYSKLSGNAEDTYRFLMRFYPQWIEDRMMSVPEGDLFFGLRRLIDENPTAKASATIESGDCKGAQTIGRIVPANLEGPIFVLIYLALVDLKFFLLVNFNHIYHYVYENVGTYQAGAWDEEMTSKLRKKVDMYTEAFKNFDKVNPNSKLPAPVEPGYFRCDPPQVAPDVPLRSHIYKFTYIKVTNFMKVFVAPEKSFRASKTCAGSCDMFDGTRAPCNTTDLACIAEFEDECVKNPEACAGFKPPCPLEDTVCIDSAPDATVCPSTRKDRILEWVKMNGQNFGDQMTTCNDRQVTYQGEWIMEKEAIADTPTLCEVCMCHCYSPVGEDLNSVRHFSLKPAVSSYSENKIVVGIKFEQIEDQIHLMIAEAKALGNGQVDMSTLVWRKPRPANQSANPPQMVTLSRRLRVLHLDDLVAPKGHVVTGARFVMGYYEGVYLHEYIGIQMQVSKIDPVTGILVPKSGRWIGNNNNTMSREPYNYVNPDDPIKADGPALPDSASSQFVGFRATSITKDLGQNTVPYFDAQRVILDHASNGWLRGIGMFHKSRPRFGGFVGLKIIKYNEKT